MPGNKVDKNPRCRLDQALKTRTTLNSELSNNLLGRNLALICGTKKQVKTLYLKQQLALKDIEATRSRLEARMKARLQRRYSIEDLSTAFAFPGPVPDSAKQKIIRRNSNVILLEKQLQRQRELFGFNKSTFRTINVYKVDKGGNVVRSFDQVPVECLFPALTISATDEHASSSNAAQEAEASAEQAAAANAANDSGDDSDAGPSLEDYYSNMKFGLFRDDTDINYDDKPPVQLIESWNLRRETNDNRGGPMVAEGQDRYDLMRIADSQPGMSREVSQLTGKVKSFMGHLNLLDMQAKDPKYGTIDE